MVYTATITADGIQSTTFISFDSTAMVIDWDEPTEAGVFTVLVTGTITN